MGQGRRGRRDPQKGFFAGLCFRAREAGRPRSLQAARHEAPKEKKHGRKATFASRTRYGPLAARGANRG